MAQETGSRSGDRKPSPRVVHELLSGKWVSQAIAVAAELGVADVLSDGPHSAAEIARATGASEDAVYRLLRALASVGLFASVGDRAFALTPNGEYLRSDVPGSARGRARYMGHGLTWRPWGELLHSVRTGEPAFDHVFGTGQFDYVKNDPEAATILNEAMTSVSHADATAVMDAYDFSGIDTLVDVGGGQGFLLAKILRTYPDMRAILYELPHAVQGAMDLLRQEGVLARCHIVAGDFFDSVPPGGDAYMMKLVIHDWDDQRANRILQNCHSVMRPRAKLLVVDYVIGGQDAPDIGKFVDLEMLVLTSGGRERTELEFRHLYDEAGFDLARIIPTKSLKCVIEGVRR
jgi:hypothetical protein